MLKELMYSFVLLISGKLFNFFDQTVKRKFNKNSTICFLSKKKDSIVAKTDTLSFETKITLLSKENSIFLVRKIIGQNKLYNSNILTGKPTVVLFPCFSLFFSITGLKLIKNWYGETKDRDNGITLIYYKNIWSK